LSGIGGSLHKVSQIFHEKEIISKKNDAEEINGE